MKDVPFYSNTPDNIHCYEATLRMILKYFFPEKEFSWSDMDRITDKRPNMWSWSTRSLINLQNMGFEVIDIEIFDWYRFSKEGTGYLEEYYSPEVAAIQTQNSDIPYEMENAKEFLHLIKVDKRIPSLSDIEGLLQDGYLVECTVNAMALDDLEGFSGHSILIYKTDGDAVYLHDPGLPPMKGRIMTFEQFDKGWAFPEERNRNITAYRLKT